MILGLYLAEVNASFEEAVVVERVNGASPLIDGLEELGVGGVLPRLDVLAAYQAYVLYLLGSASLWLGLNQGNVGGTP